LEYEDEDMSSTWTERLGFHYKYENLVEAENEEDAEDILLA